MFPVTRDKGICVEDDAGFGDVVGVSVDHQASVTTAVVADIIVIYAIVSVNYRYFSPRPSSYYEPRIIYLLVWRVPEALSLLL